MTQYGVLQNSRGVHLVVRHDGQSVASKNAIDWFDNEQSAIDYIHQIDPDWSDELPQENDEVKPPPKIVSMRQGRLALLAAGLLDQIDDAIAAIPDDNKRKAVQIEWEYAQVIDRDSPLVRTFADQLDMSEDDLDELFRQAWSL